MNIVFFGTPSFVVPILKTLIEHFTIAGVVTTPDTIAGRKKILTPSQIKQFAIENLSTVPIITSQQFNNSTIQQLRQSNPDLFVVAAYGKIIPKEILEIPRLGAINIHPSLLPKYRGTSPIQAAILNGDTETGITFIKMDEEMDHGPIIAQEAIPLKGDETFETLHQQLFQKATEILPMTIEQINNRAIKPIPQNDKSAIYCKKIAKEDGYFDFDKPPSKEKLNRMIRAYYPWPTAWTKWQIANGKSQIVKFLPGKKLQLEGGKPMSYKDFINGYPQWKEKIEKLGIL